MNQLINHAITWHLRGYVPLPVKPNGTKAPAVRWKDYQTAAPDLATVLQLFECDADGLGILTGSVSGNFELFELEGRAITEGYLPRLIQAFIDHDQRPLWDRVAGGYVELTPTGGLHYHYRVAGPAARNTKLARRPPAAGETGPQVLIETRGEGGFTVIAPSGGRTHPTGKAWTVLAGGPDQIPTLTIDERDTLHAIATTLDTMPATEGWRGSATGPSDSAGGTRPGDDYNARASWDDLLIPRGWQKARSFGRDRIGWVRPGKHPRDGISATTGGAVDGVSRLFVFSTSTDFEAEQPYTKFAALTLLEHGGDYAAAARRLAAEGWGAGQPEPILTLAAPPAAPEPPPQAHQGGAQVIAFPRAAQATTDGATALDVTQAPAVIELTDAGNADALAKRHAARLRYVPARGQWIEWRGTHWHPCVDDGEAIQAARDTIRGLPAGTDVARKHRSKSLSRSGISGCVALASKHEALRVDAELLDADPWLLNTPTGVVNLRDGTIRPAQPGDLCTRITGVPYQPGATAPRWQQFLDQTFGGDTGMIAYVQRLLGYSACGAVTHHVLPFAFGQGQNGKSVLLDVATGVLGTYASTAPNKFLMAGKDDESAIARLSGLRMVACSEVNQRAQFDEARVKLLTGGDRLTSRFLYGQYFTFVPTHKLWLMGNHQPRVEAGGESFWRRLRILPFTQKVPDEQKIEGLDKQLVDAEGPGILDWIIRGSVDVLAGGLRDPDGVMAATRTYADEEDALARFVADRLHLGSGRENTAEVRAAYAKWCRAEGEETLSQQAFGRELRTRWSINTVRSHGKRFYAGMTLLSDAEEGDDDPRTLHWSDR